MKYSKYYLYSHDIDWFCVVNGVYIHVASAGGDIPSQINDVDSLKVIQNQIEMLPDLYTNDEIDYNEPAIINVMGLTGVKERSQYIESFTAMSRKGFVSFDRTNIGNPEDNRYHMVCKPKDLNRKPQGLDLYSYNKNITFDDWVKQVTDDMMQFYQIEDKNDDNRPIG